MASAYREALVNDREVAAQLVDLPVRRGRPLLREFSPEVAALTHAVDRLTEVSAGIVALGGGKPGKPEQMPRPTTAVDDLRREREDRKHDELLVDVAAAQQRWAERKPDHPAARPRPGPEEVMPRD